MKTFTVDQTTVTEGIEVESHPFWRKCIGQGGAKKYSWIAIGSKDSDQIIEERNNLELNGKTICQTGVIKKADVIELKKKPGIFLIVKERTQENSILVFWSVSSGLRGKAYIKPEKNACIIISDKAWHSGKGILGETAQCIAILKPGQQLYGNRTGKHIPTKNMLLKYDGSKILILEIN